MTVRKKSCIIICFQIVSIFAIGGGVWKSIEADSKTESVKRTSAQIEYLGLLVKSDVVEIDDLPKNLRLDHDSEMKAGMEESIGAMMFFGIAIFAQIGVFFFTVITGWPRWAESTWHFFHCERHWERI